MFKVRQNTLKGVSRAARWLTSAWKNLSRHRGTQAAAAISFWGFLSLFSLLALAIGVAGLVFRDKPEVPERLLEYVRINLPALSDTTQDALRTATDKGGILGAIGLLGLLLSGTRVADSLQEWINLILGGSRPGWLKMKARSLAILAVLGSALVLGAGGNYLVSSRIPAGPMPGPIARTLSYLLSTGIQFLGLSFLYSYAPLPRLRLREVIPGALFSAALLNPLQTLLAWYYSRLADLSLVYGTLAGAVLLLLALYYGALLVLFGAELNLVLRGSRAGEGSK